MQITNRRYHPTTHGESKSDREGQAAAAALLVRRGFNGRLPAGVSLNLSALRDVADVTSAELQDAAEQPEQ